MIFYYIFLTFACKSVLFDASNSINSIQNQSKLDIFDIPNTMNFIQNQSKLEIFDIANTMNFISPFLHNDFTSDTKLMKWGGYSIKEPW